MGLHTREDKQLRKVYHLHNYYYPSFSLNQKKKKNFLRKADSLFPPHPFFSILFGDPSYWSFYHFLVCVLLFFRFISYAFLVYLLCLCGQYICNHIIFLALGDNIISPICRQNISHWCKDINYIQLCITIYWDDN